MTHPDEEAFQIVLSRLLDLATLHPNRINQ